MRGSRSLLLNLAIWFCLFMTITHSHALQLNSYQKSDISYLFPLKSIDITPKEEIRKIKKTRNYPLTYREAVKLLEEDLLNNQSPSSLFQYTLLSEESKGDGEASPEKVRKIMINFLKNSVIQLNQKELDGNAWPRLNSKTHLLFILHYNMDGFIAVIKFIIDRKSGSVSLEEIAD